MKIEYQNGKVEDVENEDAAKDIIEAEYPDAVYGDDWEQINEYRRRLLVWENEDAAEEDDGSHAIAEIVEMD